MRGTVTLVSGDNLGSHFIGGYKQLSSAHRKCRFCMAVDTCIGEHVSVKPCLHVLYMYMQVKYTCHIILLQVQMYVLSMYMYLYILGPPFKAYLQLDTLNGPIN